MTENTSMIIASHQSEWVKEQSAREVKIAVYLPFQQETGEWGCRINIDLEIKYDNVIYGEDSFQSLKLTLRHARILIDGFIARGWRIIEKSEDGGVVELSEEVMNKYINALF